MPVVVAYIDRQQRCAYSNELFNAYFSPDPGAAARREDAARVFGAATYALLLPGLECALSGRRFDDAAWWTLPDGRQIFLRISLIPHIVRGEVAGAMLSAVDVSGYKQLETELRATKAAADAESQTKSQFLANISHEIRTPLGTVLGFSELLTSPDLAASDRLACVAAIRRNGELLSNIVNDVLDLSKAEAGKMQMELAATKMSDVTASLDALIRMRATEKGLTLVLRPDSQLPAAIYTDPFRLRQILLNIVGNAVKFTSQGSIDVAIRMQQHGSRQLLAFVVTDTGCGIEAHYISKLFAPFAQADASITRKFGGTGLGLALSKHLAQALGGDVELTSSCPGQGSIFTVSIDPGVPEQVLLDACPSGAPDPEQATLSGLRILLAEDFVDNQELICSYLQSAGADVDFAVNGLEAVAMAGKEPYDLLLMDLQMPLMGGTAATAELRRNGYQKPIIALTAHAMHGEYERCLEQGFNDHIGKPIEWRRLLQRIAFHAKTSAIDASCGTRPPGGLA